MRIFVTGITGQLAMSLNATAATMDGVEVRAFGRPDLDLLRPVTIRSCLQKYRPDIVINAAAFTNVDGAEDAPDDAYSVNATGAEGVARETQNLDIPIIHVSTDYVFDGTKRTPYSETDTPNPLSVYGRTKLAGEHAVAIANPRHIIARTSWVFSPYGNNFLKTMLRLSKTRSELGVVADQFGAPTYAPHLAEALIALAHSVKSAPERDTQTGVNPPWGIYHITGSGEASWHEFADFIFAEQANIVDRRIQVNAISTAEFPTRAPRPENSRLDNSKLDTTFGLKLPHWHQGTRSCLAQFNAK